MFWKIFDWKSCCKLVMGLMLMSAIPAVGQESMHGDKEGEVKIGTGVLTAANKDGLPTPPEGYKWVRDEPHSDEFNDTKLDTKKWIPYHPYWSGRNSKHEPVNISVKDGNLRLKSTLREGATEVKGATVMAACVSSKKKDCMPGYYEARIKCSKISMTSAFWFKGTPAEIDVIENIGNPSKRSSAWIEDTMMMNTHYFGKINGKRPPSTPAKWKMPSKSCDEYMVYSVWWKDKDTVWMYHNGAKVKEFKTPGPFDNGQHLFFDTEVFTWHGWPKRENLLDDSKNTMLVDWVRAWKLEKI